MDSACLGRGCACQLLTEGHFTSPCSPTIRPLSRKMTSLRYERTRPCGPKLFRRRPFGTQCRALPCLRISGMIAPTRCLHYQLLVSDKGAAGDVSSLPKIPPRKSRKIRLHARLREVRRPKVVNAPLLVALHNAPLLVALHDACTSHDRVQGFMFQGCLHGPHASPS